MATPRNARAAVASQRTPPTLALQLAWLEQEIGVFFHFTMYTFVSQPSPMDKHEDCGQFQELKEMQLHPELGAVASR